ncbi:MULTISPECIES: DUF4190 domain-containing protein [Leucobacter]|uniref:DUF4190 domain-containing protein n=1 Tax=Leucobacter alluvii TaxID=340321 RepID=A0ABN3B1H8_9MICO|nr:DUF4190 domain-containing protein [Leucobacter manosquensis]
MSATITPETTVASESGTAPTYPLVTDTTPLAASSAASNGSEPFPSGPVNINEHSRAFSITSFVLGIASVVSGWTFFAPITGLVFGILALRRGTQDRALALWGVWLNAVMLALWVLAGIVAVAVFGFGALALVFAA